MRDFVETSIARTVRDTVNYARQYKRAAAIVGPPGVGKTYALSKIARDDHSCAFVTASAAQATFKSALRLIADALEVNCQQDSADKIWRAMENSLGTWDHGNRILMIDEAQRLDLNALVEIVDLPNRFGLPVVVCGNGDLLRRKHAQRAAFAQIASRLGMKAIVKEPTHDDFVRVMVNFNVEGKPAYEAGVNYGLNTSLRELVQMLEAARECAARGSVGVAHMQQAILTVRGETKALSLLSSAA